MYFMFRYKGMMPSVYAELNEGEKRIIAQFMYKELDEKIEENKHMSNLFNQMRM